MKGEREILLELEEIKKRENRSKLGNSANVFSGKAALMELEKNSRPAAAMIEMASTNGLTKQATFKPGNSNKALEAPLIQANQD